MSDSTSSDSGVDSSDGALAELADAYGIEVDWIDQTGAPQRVGEQTLRIVLAALDVPAADDHEVRVSLIGVRAAGRRALLPAHVIARQGRPLEVPLRAPAGVPVAVELRTEDGDRRALTMRPAAAAADRDETITQYTLEIPDDLPAGYHSLHARLGSQESDPRSEPDRRSGSESGSPPDTRSCPLVVAPERLAAPAAGRRVFGIAAQLYSVRSESSWGLGDLGDLAELAAWAGGVHGADFVAVNPLCAAAPEVPRVDSPYLPTTKRFTDPSYLAVEGIAEYGQLSEDDRGRVDALARSVAPDSSTVPADPLTDPAGAAAGVGLLNRDAAWLAKRDGLTLLHAAGRSPGRQALFEVFVRHGGEQLRRFAIWNVLAGVHGPDSLTWPAELREPGLPAVEEFARAEAVAVDFQLWLQWCLSIQLDAATRAADEAGMAIGIVHDLPIGVHPGGADHWTLPGVFAADMSVGAPPDMFNQQGQDWSAPPMRPERLAGDGLWLFRDQVRAILRHAGGVRIDHVLGLFRLWWVPAGLGSAGGAYVRYDHEALISVLVLEASRAGAVVVGEDLGTVAPWVQGYLSERGILGTSILWFERGGHGRPRAPHEWRTQTMGSVTVHDLPPTAGYLRGEHVRLRGGLGQLGRPIEEEAAADEAERARWIEELRAGGFLALRPNRGADPGDEADIEELILALHRYLVATGVAMVAVGLPDAVGDERSQNLPGTGAGDYPNWRLPLTGPDGHPMLLADVERDPRAARLLQLVRTGLGGADEPTR